jgi:hypothetical protein
MREVKPHEATLLMVAFVACTTAALLWLEYPPSEEDGPVPAASPTVTLVKYPHPCDHANVVVLDGFVTWACANGDAYSTKIGEK